MAIRFLALIALVLMACGPAGENEPGVMDEPAAEVVSPDGLSTRSAGAEAGAAQSSELGLGPGFVVWESNRTGRWRLWIRELGGGEPRRLTPDEGRRIHCCPHISPDGEQIAFLSLPPDQKLYPRGGAIGRMDLIRPDGTGARPILDAARNYFENRAAIWRSPDELIFIEASGHAAILDLESGEQTRLTKQAEDKHPWLINGQLAWAASGTGGFGEFDPETGYVAVRNPLPGCQPYFSYDGRWGFWVHSPGGPLKSIDLASGETGTLLKKSDPRLPADRGFLYFPMLSSDSRLLAYGASPDEFNHFKSDYDIFVVEIDPESLEILDRPVRITEHPSADRYPDVYVAPLPLGRHQGEAPFHWRFDPQGSARDLQWDFGDGKTAMGPSADHLFEQAGRYEVRATADGEELRGQVVVEERVAPRVVSVSLLEVGREIAVVFDEPVNIDNMVARIGSEVEIEEAVLDRRGRRLRLRLAVALERSDRLELAGVRDLAQQPNELPAVELPIELPVWPSNRSGLVFLFQTANAPNLIYDQELGADTAVQLEARGRARFNNDFALLPSGGYFRASDEASERVFSLGKSTYELSIEAVLQPYPKLRDRVGVVLDSGTKRHTNFTLLQHGVRLKFMLRRDTHKSAQVPGFALLALPPGGRSHVLITYSPGSLRAYLNGEEVVVEGSSRKGFFHWLSAPLTIGANADGGLPWPGLAEGLAIYNRVLDSDEVRENYLRYQAILEKRLPIDSWQVLATRQECSAVPSLEEINPYREALSVCAYRIEEVLQGSPLPPRVRVAQWTILDGERFGIEGAKSDAPAKMFLSPFAGNRQLESVYLSDTLDEAGDLPLFYWSNP